MRVPDKTKEHLWLSDFLFYFFNRQKKQGLLYLFFCV